MIRRRSQSKNRRRGAVAVVVTICLIPLIGILAFAIDGGLLLGAKRRAQTIADTSAHAAACQLYLNYLSDTSGLDVSGKARQAALSMASANGYTNDGSISKVTINIPPQSGYFKNQAHHAEILVTYYQTRMFSGIFGSGTFPISARAVARGTTSGGGPYSSASLLLLDFNSAGSLNLSGASKVVAEAAIQVNSSNVQAAIATGSASASAPSIQIVGNYSATGSGYFTTTKDSSVRTAAPSVPDPLASLAAPDPSKLARKLSTVLMGRKPSTPAFTPAGSRLAVG